MSKESWIMAYERGLANGMSSAMAAETAHERIEQGAGLTDAGRLCADIPIEVEDEQETKHTPEPWRIAPFSNDDEVLDIVSEYVAHPNGTSCANWIAQCDLQNEDDGGAENAANARRIVSCVNACAGINPEAVPDLIEAARELIAERDDPVGWCGHSESLGFQMLRDALAKAGVK